MDMYTIGNRLPLRIQDMIDYKENKHESVVEMLDLLTGMAESDLERIAALPEWLSQNTFIQHFKENAELEIQAYSHIKQILEEM